MKKLTIVGCGQVGSVLADSLQHRYRLRILESSQRLAFGQQPWGWLRRVTLQQPRRIQLPLEDLSLPSFKGPMLLTTNSPSRAQVWKEWLNANKENTDAQLFTGIGQHQDNFGLTDRYQLLCDSRDSLFDFTEHRNQLVSKLYETTEFYKDAEAKEFHWENETLLGLTSTKGDFFSTKDHKVLVCLGNNTRKFLKIPTLGMRLAFSTFPAMEAPYRAVWRDETSIQHFPTYTKVGCGFRASVAYLPPYRYLPFFLPLLKKSHYSMFTKPSVQLQDATEAWSLSTNDVSSCIVDITPSFLPIIHSIGNVTFIYGMSGSGFTIYEPWFQRIVFGVMEGNAIVNPFDKYTSLFPTKSFLY